MARYVMTIDAESCIHCQACVIACQQKNNVPFGFSRNWVRVTPAKTMKSGFAFQPGACMHCANPVCVEACPTSATFKNSDGAVVIDKDRCIGCGGCIDACPYDARYRNPVTGTADKCDYCRENSAPGEGPACVSVCPMHCRVFGDADDPQSEVSAILAGSKQVFVTPKTLDTRPTLTYLNATTPTDWPRASAVPPMLAAMGPVSKLIKYVGGAAVFGVIGVFFKQLVLPSDREHGPAGDQPSAQNKRGQQK